MPNITLAAPIARWLRQPGRETTFPVSGATVREALESLFSLAPTLRGYLLDDQGGLRHHVAAFIDNVVVTDKQALATPVAPHSEIYLVQALSGG